MLMKMLEAGGLPIVTDGLRTADEDNPKGYYEDERVKDLARRARTRAGCRRPAARGSRSSPTCSSRCRRDNNYRVVFIRRDLAEVLASQKKMLARRGEAEDDIAAERMRELFEDDLWRASYLLKHRPQFETLERPLHGRPRAAARARRGASTRSSAAASTSRPWPPPSTRSSTATAPAAPPRRGGPRPTARSRAT